MYIYEPNYISEAVGRLKDYPFGRRALDLRNELVKAGKKDRRSVDWWERKCRGRVSHYGLPLVTGQDHVRHWWGRGYANSGGVEADPSVRARGVCCCGCRGVDEGMGCDGITRARKTHPRVGLLYSQPTRQDNWCWVGLGYLKKSNPIKQVTVRWYISCELVELYPIYYKNYYVYYLYGNII
jgi:hypothetical protein